MVTIFTALAVLGSCAAVRWYLDRSSRRETEYGGGRIRLKALWNHGASFGIPVPSKWICPASALALLLLWTRRRRSAVGAGLVLGGGLSNLLERLRCGKVYDYVQFPRAPGRLKRYVFNIADFAVFLGAISLATRRKR